jgi:FAD:protein FMN transferase
MLPDEEPAFRPRDICHVEHVMGTAVSFDIRDAPYQGESTRVLHRATAWLHRIDAIFSTFRADSELSRLQRGELGPAERSPEMVEVFNLAAECQVRTGGAYDLYWRPDKAPDPTGVVKGWAANWAGLLLVAAGLGNHSINAAGDVRLSGHPRPGMDWSIGVSHPLRPGMLVAVVEASDAGVATSGYAQQGRHIIDPRTGLAAYGAASVTVIGPSLGRADGYATAAVSRGKDAPDLLEQLDHQGWSSVLVTDDGETWASPGFPGAIFPEGIHPESM